MLTVPWALDANGQLVTPEEASSSEGLRCPDPACCSRLILRAGDIRAHHFAHIDEGRCSLESVEHAAAKHLLAKVVLAFLSVPDKRPNIHRTCLECGKVVAQPLPRKVREARVEEAIDGFRADVLLLDEAQHSVCVIEVLHTHAVTEEKAKGLSVPWIELVAVEVLASPLQWVPRRANGLRPLRCDHAGTEFVRRKEEDAKREQRAAEDAKKRMREAKEKEAARIELSRMRAGWCPFPLAPGQYLADITGQGNRWWPMDAWWVGSMHQAVAMLETHLGNQREFCRYFDSWSTVSVSIRSWDENEVRGTWRNGKWVKRPDDGGRMNGPDRGTAGERILVLPPIRRGRRL